MTHNELLDLLEDLREYATGDPIEDMDEDDADDADDADQDRDEAQGSPAVTPATAEKARLARHRSAERLGVLILAMRTVALSGPDPVEPEPDATPEEAEPTLEERDEMVRQLFERGQNAYEEKDYGEAFDTFLAAYEVKPAAALLYNAAVCAERLEDYASAGDLFEQYLANRPDARDRELVEERVRRLREGQGG